MLHSLKIKLLKMFRLPIKLLLLVIILMPILVPAQEKGRKRHKTEEARTAIDTKESTEIFIDATKARLLGDYARATTLFTRSLELDPSNDAALYELAQICYSQADYSTAAGMVEKAINIDPNNAYYRLLAIEIYGKSGRKDDLLKAATQLVKQFPGNADYLYELANAYLMTGKADDALRTYNEIEDIIGINEDVSMQKQRIYMVLNKPDKASAEIENLIDAFPDDAARYYSILAEINMQANKPDVAASYYQKIIEVNPDDPYVHISLSDYYRKKGDMTKSKEELRSGFANPALDVDTKVRILTAYYSIQEIYNDKKEEVLGLSDILLKAHPGDAKALALNGDLLLNDRKYTEARDRFRQVIAIDSSRYSSWESLLQAEASLPDWPSLLEESNRSLELFPFQPLPYFFNGLALVQLKKPEEAIKIFNNGVKLVTGNEPLLNQFYSYLGDAYNQTGQHDKSDESYEKVLKSEPDNSYVLNNYAYYLSLRGVNLEKALAMAKKGAEKDSLNPANLDTYGWVLFKLGRYTEAKEWVKKALLASPEDDPDLLEHYGDILFKLNDLPGALDYWKKAQNAGNRSAGLEKKIKEKRLIE